MSETNTAEVQEIQEEPKPTDAGEVVGFSNSIEEKFSDKPEVIPFCNNLKKLIQDAILLLSQHDKLSPEKWKSSKKDIFRRFKNLYEIPISHPETETLRKRLLKHKDEILTFLKYPKVVEPTNNRAERSLRNLVIFRKITFGNRSDQGTKNVSDRKSVVQGKSVDLGGRRIIKKKTT